MERETKQKLIRVVITAILLIICKMLDWHFHFSAAQLFFVYALPYLLISYDILAEAAEGITEGNVFNEDFLMAIATIGAMTIGFLPNAQPENLEAVFVMLFYQVGEIFEEIAEGNSRKSISQLMEIRPDAAHVERADAVVTVAPDDVAVGEVVVVKPGEKIPVDGRVVSGQSNLDTRALTGESLPRPVGADDAVISGCVNLNGLLRIQVAKKFADSTASKILDLVENAGDKKSKSERFISRFARIYTPAVVIVALLLAVFPPVLSGHFAAQFPIWLNRALTFLVVSCPCALVISVPLTFFSGIGGASKQGILIKGSNFMEALAKAGTVVFDKTGTLTEGVFQVTAVHQQDIDENELLHMAAHVERFSTHPIANSLRLAYPQESDTCLVTEVQEVAGQGIQALVNGRLVHVGNSKLMTTVGADWSSCDKVGTIIHVASDGTYLGHIVISDIIKPDAKQAIDELKAVGIKKTVMLTGDQEAVAASVASELGVDDYQAELLPADKVEQVEQLLQEKSANESLVFVGDGINDAPVLARADVGIAMGALGSDAAIEAADVVLMDDKPSKISTAIRIARRTLSIAKQNTIFAIVVKLSILVLAGFGLASMWLAVFADVGVMVLAILNASRALRV